VVNPEQTRRDIIDQVREILKSENKTVKFVKFVEGNFIEDVTAEIVAEASAEMELA
jgi:3-hydroxyacyl-CoA dehydrogenase